MSLDWMTRAACLGLASVFESRDHRPQALHICLYHCPVRRECQAYTAQYPAPIDIVQAGKAYSAVLKHGRTPELVRPTPTTSCRRCVEERLAELTDQMVAHVDRQLVDN